MTRITRPRRWNHLLVYHSLIYVQYTIGFSFTSLHTRPANRRIAIPLTTAHTTAPHRSGTTIKPPSNTQNHINDQQVLCMTPIEQGKHGNTVFSSSSSPTNKDPISSPPQQPQTHEHRLPPILRPDPNCDPKQMSPTSLAYIGDSVFELCVRSRYVWPSRRTSDLQTLVVGKVRAETQSLLYRKLTADESSSSGSSSNGLDLTAEERTILSRGRNAGASSGGRKRGPKRLYGKATRSSGDDSSSAANGSSTGGGGGGPEVYQESTALEALVGYAYLTDETRCFQILEFCMRELDAMDE